MTAAERIVLRMIEAEACAATLQRAGFAEEDSAVQVLLSRAAAFDDAVRELGESVAEDAVALAFDIMETPQPEGTTSTPGTCVAPSTPAAASSGHPLRRGPPPSRWTPERLALLAKLWPEGAPSEAIRQAVNALPGPAIATGMAVESQAKKIGARRAPSVATAIRQANMASARAVRTTSAITAAPGPASAPEPAPEPVMVPEPEAPAEPQGGTGDNVLAFVDADELTEARQMMRGGRIGAKDLAEWFGWDLSRAQEIAAAIRAEQDGRAAA